jgi:hypothetical protein
MPKPPLKQIVNTDSVESALKALDDAKRLPCALALPRQDDQTRLPRTDDTTAPCAAFVTTNFETIDDAAAFLNNVCCGDTPRFRSCEELLARDTPRKPSVVILCTQNPNAPIKPADQNRHFMTFLPSIITSMAAVIGREAPTNAADFAVSEIIDRTVHAFAVIDNAADGRIADADAHAAYVSAVKERATLPGGIPVGSFELVSPERHGTSFAYTINDVVHVRIPVALQATSRGYNKIFHAVDRPMIKMVPVGGDRREKQAFAPLNTTLAAHLFTAGPRPATAPTLSLTGRLEYGQTTVNSLPDDRLRALWTVGLGKLCTALFTTTLTPDKVFLASHMPNRCRWFNETGTGGCPLCEGDCPHVDLRLMPVAGLMASCATCPPDRAVVVGPLFTPSFGRLETRTDAIVAEPIIDCNGIARMAPFTDYSPRPSDRPLVPSGRPGAGKSFTAFDDLIRTMEDNCGSNMFYIVIAPFKLLVASHVKTLNRLFWAKASDALKEAYYYAGYISSTAPSTESERECTPFRHYASVNVSEMTRDGGHVVTTTNSAYRFAPIFNEFDMYGRSNVGYVLIDELETIPAMLMDPTLVNHSSVEDNIICQFNLLRLSQRGVPVVCLDGFVTDEISGRLMKAAGVPFTEMRCNVGIFAGRKLTVIRDYLTHPSAGFLGMRMSVGGTIKRIIASIEAGRNPQVFCSSKKQLRALFSLITKHFSGTSRAFFIITGDTSPEERMRANEAAEGRPLDGKTFGAIFTTSAVGGGLNFEITRDVFAIILRDLANGQEAWQTYLRSRKLENIYLCYWRSLDGWDSRLHDSFAPVTDSVRWMIKARRRAGAPRALRA